MTEETEKQSIRDIMCVAHDASMRPEFYEKITNAWIKKTQTESVNYHFFGMIQVQSVRALHWWWFIGLIILSCIGFFYWQHLQELENIRQFDVLMEYSLGTL